MKDKKLLLQSSLVEILDLVFEHQIGHGEKLIHDQNMSENEESIVVRHVTIDKNNVLGPLASFLLNDVENNYKKETNLEINPLWSNQYPASPEIILFSKKNKEELTVSVSSDYERKNRDFSSNDKEIFGPLSKFLKTTLHNNLEKTDDDLFAMPIS